MVVEDVAHQVVHAEWRIGPADDIGAALVEATTESYFFKHTRDADASVISFFRASRPLAYLLGALLGTLSLLYIPFNYTFVLLGILMLPGIACAMLLKDTR